VVSLDDLQSDRDGQMGGSAYHLRVQNNRGNFGGSDVFDTLGQMGYRNKYYTLYLPHDLFLNS